MKHSYVGRWHNWFSMSKWAIANYNWILFVPLQKQSCGGLFLIYHYSQRSVRRANYSNYVSCCRPISMGILYHCASGRFFLISAQMSPNYEFALSVNYTYKEKEINKVTKIAHFAMQLKQFSIKCQSYSSLASLQYPTQSIQYTTKTNHDVFTFVFSRFRQIARSFLTHYLPKIKEQNFFLLFKKILHF